MESLRHTSLIETENGRAPEPDGVRFRADDSRLTLEAAGVSHPGKRRRNEDQYLIADLATARRRGAALPPGGSPQECLLVVADGMGGRRCGEVASLLAVRVLVKELLRRPVEDGDPLRRLDRALRASDEVIHRAGARADLASMGTTLTAAWWIPPMLYFAHVGDSRLYLLHDGRLDRLTRDHTVAADLLASGVQAAKTAGFEHFLTQAVGGGEKGVEPEEGSRRLEEEDVLLLCTDGLVRGVTDDEIARALRLADTARIAVVALLEGALATDDDDNITAVAACVRPAPRRGAMETAPA